MADAVRRLVVGGILLVMVNVFCFLKEVEEVEGRKGKRRRELLTHEDSTSTSNRGRTEQEKNGGR